MKYQVIYYKRKKKQTAVFYEIEGAMLWENYIRQQGIENVQILVK